MKDMSLHEAFVRAMEKEIPKKTKLADFVADSLCIEKETAYRRLRGEVQFSLREAGILATLLNLSLDSLINDHSKSLTLGLPIDYRTGTYDRSQIEDIINYLHEFTQEPGCEFAMALSGIPFSLFLQYKRLARFYRLKYVNHTTNRPVSIPYGKIEESDAKIEYREELYLLFRQIAHTCYVWDRHIINLLVNDIRYAESVRLIANWEVAELKQELFRFLDDLEQVAIKGVFPETGNKFELYISDTHIDVSYAYMCSEKRLVSTLSAFVIFSSISQEIQTFQKVNNWVKSLKRFSTLVSGIGERERILFFEEQRRIVATL